MFMDIMVDKSIFSERERYAICRLSVVCKRGCSTVQKIVIEIVIEICMEQTRLFQWNRFHYAENRHSPSRFFFGKWVQTVITNAACAAATFIYTLNHKNVTFYF